MPIVSLTNVSKTYPSRTPEDGEIVAVDDVTLEIEKGDVFGIIGYSGAGKSTLVRLINALEPATGGSIPSTASTSPRSRRASCAASAAGSA